MENYDVVYQGGSGEIVEKKSRFIANVFSVTSEEEAQRILEETRKRYWDARHNCYAYCIGSRSEITRCSDDSEPSGTAGRPILEVITGQNVHNVLIIVTRYFGGTLLGTGGLVRAYSQAAKAGLMASQIVTRIPGKKLVVGTDYNGAGKLQYIAGQHNLAVMDTQYSDKVEMTLLVGLEDCGKIEKEITEATAGKASLEFSDELYFAVIDKKPVIVKE